MFILRKPGFGSEVLISSLNLLENLPWRLENEIKTEKDKYEICLQVNKNFSPKDITVNIEDGYIVVEAKHEEKKDEHGYITRQFKRKYLMPEDCIGEKVESRLSSDGVLTIVAPRKVVDKQDTVIPVTHENKIKSKL